MSFSYSQRALNVMLDTYKYALGPTAPLVEAPVDALKLPLRAHQQAVLAAMERQETSLLGGLDCSGERLYSSYAVLGDSVGVGKSLMVLGHIARLAVIPPLKSKIKMEPHSSAHMFSTLETPFTDASEAGCLVVVPHTLFRQWADYTKKQTNLKALFLDKRKCFQSDTFLADVLAADMVLISNTLYKEFSILQNDQKLRWKRVFFDEADTIHMVNGYPRPEARFTWFITASWMNVLFPNETVYATYQTMAGHIFNEGSAYAPLRPFFEEAYKTHRPSVYLRHYMTSFNFFRDILNQSHPLRGRLVVRCTEEFVKQSISLPPLVRTNIMCKAPITQRIVSELVPADVQQLLHGGDVAGAISALGVKAEDTGSLIEAVTQNLKKELGRLQATHTFKAGLEYSTPQAKEAALKALEDKMKQKEEAIKSIQQRIEGFKNEMCPICYDEPSEPLLTPCCSRIFCAQCIFACLSRAPTCPMCREGIHASRLKRVVAKEEMNTIVSAGGGAAAAPLPEEVLLKKPEALYRLFKENPRGRFLVFSRYDNPFNQMESSIEALGIHVKQLKGNKDAIAATLRAFQGGDLRCLLLNSHYAGAGLNITAATHVVLLHAMTHEEEKQILGRAYRMGRTEPLYFYRLLHADEVPTVN